MLYKIYFHYRFDTDEHLKLDSEIAVKFHGAIMNNTDQQLAEFLHQSTLHPFSIYARAENNGLFVKISSLSDEASYLADTLSGLRRVKIFGCSKEAELIGSEIFDPIEFSSLGNSLPDIVTVNILSPAIYHSKKKILNLPYIEKYFHSVICKINEFENTSIDYDNFISAFERSKILNYTFSDKIYKLSGISLQGMIGSFKIKMPKEKQSSLLLKKVLAYAEYSGIGAKTGLGMGAVNIL